MILSTRSPSHPGQDPNGFRVHYLGSSRSNHPEYSPSPPAFPKEWPSCTYDLFAISTHWINILKHLMRKYTDNQLTTNTIICALIWTSITRVRAHHNPSLKDPNEMSRLATAVNALQHISSTLSSGSLFFGNAVFYALSTFPARGLASSDETPVRKLAPICDHIVRSQSASTINSRHIAEVVQLIDRVGDPRSLFVG